MQTKYIKSKINNTQQNCKCRLCGEENETINHIMSEGSTKKYKIKHGWKGEVVPLRIVQEIEVWLILPNGLCTNQSPSERMSRIKFSGILRYK